MSGTGKQNVDRRLSGLNAGVCYGNPVLVLRDLDQDEPCASRLVARLLPDRHPKLLLRICVRSVENWLMADTDAYCRFLGVKAHALRQEPEVLDNPKKAILRMGERGTARGLQARLHDGRARGVPDWAILGELHAEFATLRWNPARAAASGTAPCLARAITRLQTLLQEQGSFPQTGA